jgi:hypothetical protein
MKINYSYKIDLIPLNPSLHRRHRTKNIHIKLIREKMEYRKKNIKPKQNLASNVQQTLQCEKLMDTIDFFQ